MQVSLGYNHALAQRHGTVRSFQVHTWRTIE
jgi:hypothetical protein